MTVFCHIRNMHTHTLECAKVEKNTASNFFLCTSWLSFILVNKHLKVTI